LKRKILHTILFVLVIFIIQNKGYAQKTDTIIHINGNVLTGDFKKMEYGVAIWKMDGMGTISVEEVKINTIKSDKLFEIKMKNGLIYFGSFDTSMLSRQVFIVKTDRRALISIDDIVEIYPIKGNFWMRLSGNFSLGANLSKGSNVGTVSLAGNLDYRKRKTYFGLSWDANNTYQSDTLSSTKSDIEIGWQRLLKKSWSAGLAVGSTQNTELGTKLRLTLSMVGLKDISYNNWNRLYVGAGLSVARETPYDESGISHDLAGIAQVAWKVYKYTSPKVWLNSHIDFIPYLTTNRYRVSFNLNPQVSLFSDDFKVGISLYYNYDSNPTSDASTNDYGLNLQLTYSLH